MSNKIIIELAPEDRALFESLRDALTAGTPTPTAAPAKAEEKAAETKAEAPATKVEEKAAPAITRDEVRAKLKAHAAAYGKDAAIRILKDAGAESIGTLPEDQFEAVIAAVDAADGLE